MTEAVISDWQEDYAAVYGKENLLLHHRLADTGLFQRETLGKLIDSYPDDCYNLNTMGYDPENPVWREGTIQGYSGSAVIDAIARGRMWLNLRQVEKIDSRFERLLTKIFDEFETNVPSLHTFKRKLGILISSPLVQVFYHADVPGQSLWQIEGEKRVYVYPNRAPYLGQKSLEGIILGETQEDIPYERGFDEGAQVHDLVPGQMVHWPLNCPHRVENKDCLNISVTTEHWTSDLRKSYAVNYGNGVLRKFGFNTLSQSINGPTVYPKAALAMFWRSMQLNQRNKFVRMIDFAIDPEQDTGITDVPAFAKGS